MVTPTSPKSKRIRDLERGLHDTRQIAFQRGEKITSLAAEVAELSEKMEQAEQELQAAQQVAQLSADARLETVARQAGQRITCLGALWPTAEEVFGEDLQPDVPHTNGGPLLGRGVESSELLEQAIDNTFDWLPQVLRATWGQKNFQKWVMKGSRRLTAFTLNYVSSHGNEIFGISDPNFKDPEYRKTIPAVQALLANQAFMFGEGVNFNDRHSVVCLHGRNQCTRNIPRYMLRGGTYVQLGHRTAHAKPSRAAMWQITQVTPPMLALALTLAYHVLLGNPTFYNKHGGTNYAEFYKKRITQLLLMRERTETEYKALFGWLNKDLFPQPPPPTDAPDVDVEMNTGERFLMDALDGWDSDEGESDEDGE